MSKAMRTERESPRVDAHGLVSRALLAMSRLMELAEAGALGSQEACTLADLASDSMKAAVGSAHRPVELLIGKSSLQLHGDALRAPSWVYDAAWSLGSRISGDAICALHVAESISPDEIVGFVATRAPGQAIRAFSLPQRYASLVEAPGQDPGIGARTAVVLVSVARELRSASERGKLAIPLLVSVARSVVELCELGRDGSMLFAEHAHPSEGAAWIATEAAMLAGEMTLQATSSRKPVYDSVLAVLLLAARRAWVSGPVAPPAVQPDATDAWVLGLEGAEQVSPQCLVLLQQLDELVWTPLPPRVDLLRTPTLQARIVCLAWWTAHVTASDGVEQAGGVLQAARAIDEDGEPSVAELLDVAIRAAHGPAAPGNGVGEARPEVEAAATPQPALAAVHEAEEKAAPRPFTRGELDSFLDEFVGWGGSG